MMSNSLHLHSDRLMGLMRKLEGTQYALFVALTTKASSQGPAIGLDPGCVRLSWHQMPKIQCSHAAIERAWKALKRKGFAKLVKRDWKDGDIYLISNYLVEGGPDEW